MSKTGIIAYILAAIFVGCCFWIVGCADNGSDGCIAPEPSLANYTTDSSFTCNDGVYEYRN